MKQSDLRKIRMMGLSDSERISITGSAVLTQYTRERRTDYGINVAHKRYSYSIDLLTRVKTSNTTNLKKPPGTPGGCLRLPVYGRLSLVKPVVLR